MAAIPAAMKLYGFAYFKYFAWSAWAIFDDIFVIPATGEVTSPKVPPVIIAATQRGMPAPDTTAIEIAPGMSKEAAPQPEPMKYVTAEDNMKSETATLHAGIELPKFCCMNSFKPNACETDAKGHAKARIIRVVIILLPPDILSDVISLRLYF